MDDIPTSLQRPASSEAGSGYATWKEQDQPWRTQPEIDIGRQQYLKQCLAVLPDETQGKYPFKNVVLSRADVEWLLVTHEIWDESVDWSYGLFRRHIRLDLRGVILREIDLSSLPLEKVNLGGANLYGAHLERTNLYGAHLEKASLYGAHLESAILAGGHLEDAKLDGAYLERAYLARAHMERASLQAVHLEEAVMTWAHLEEANLSMAHLEEANLEEAHLEKTNLYNAHLEKAHLREAYLEGAKLSEAHLEEADLRKTHLEKAHLYMAHLEGTNLHRAYLEGADLAGAFFSSATNLRNITLGNEKFGFVSLAGARWGDVDLSVIHWKQVKVLGEEHRARQRKTRDGGMKDMVTRLDEYRTAVRANRQLAVVLQAQGLNEEATHFAYRAQILQRVVARLQGNIDQYIFSVFLSVVSGYGYKLWRSLAIYVCLIIAFAAVYYQLRSAIHVPFSLVDALVFSLTSFHGRGFSPGESIGLSNPLTIVAAIEAFVGLIMEVTLVATLSQRFFKR